MIKIIAVLCHLSIPENCHEQIVTTSDFADVSMVPLMARRSSPSGQQHPAERRQHGAASPSSTAV